MPTVSFVHSSKKSAEIVKACAAAKIECRHGHMYEPVLVREFTWCRDAFRLCTALGLNPTDGVVRVSLVHYNTEEEVQRLIVVLNDIL